MTIFFSVGADIPPHSVCVRSLFLFSAQVYFHFLKTWVNLSSGHILEEQWNTVKKICTSIRGGEAEAGRKFW